MFDDMSRDELLRQCQRLYSAASSMENALAMCRCDEPKNLYWTHGSGAVALEKGAQALAAARGDYEQAYDGFYAYADMLLFEPKQGLRISNRWYVCQKCNATLSVGIDAQQNLSGKSHATLSQSIECDGVFRSYGWADLRHSSSPDVAQSNPDQSPDVFDGAPA
jgi:hypothetical protein